jgi:hypothetical protein
MYKYSFLFVLILFTSFIAQVQTTRRGGGTGGGTGGSWDFQYTCDNASGTDYAVIDGTPTQGTFTDGGAVSDAQNHTPGGTYSFAVNGNDDINWVSSPNTAEGRLETWVYISSFAASACIIEIDANTFDGTNQFRLQIETDQTVYFRREANNVVVTMNSTATIPADTWTRICARWSVTNNLISLKIGAGSWEDDGDADALQNMTASLTYFRVGSGVSSTSTGACYEDDVVYYDTYDADWNGE